jgi:hypothetical protein
VGNELTPTAFTRWAKGTVSVAEGHVARIDVQQKNAIAFESTENRRDFRPIRAELLCFLGAPIAEDLCGEFGWLVESGTGEIENKGPADDGHFDAAKIVVEINERRNVAPAYCGNVAIAQPEVAIALAAVAPLSDVHLHRRTAAFGLAFRGESTSLEVQTYSARVRMELHLNGSVLNISHLGPDYLILSQPVDHPPAQAEIVMSIDGKQSRWEVGLPAGVSAGSVRTSISPAR